MANIVIACPVCLQKIRAPENVIGRVIKCPQCKNSFTAADPAAPVTAVVTTPMEAEESLAADPLGLEEKEFYGSERRSKKGSPMVDYLLLRRMVTPVIITALFYVGVAILVISGMITAVMGIMAMINKQVGYGLVLVFSALVGTVIWLILWRIWCEIIILFFQMLAKLQDIHDELKKS